MVRSWEEGYGAVRFEGGCLVDRSGQAEVACFLELEDLHSHRHLRCRPLEYQAPASQVLLAWEGQVLGKRPRGVSLDSEDPPLALEPWLVLEGHELRVSLDLQGRPLASDARLAL